MCKFELTKIDSVTGEKLKGAKYQITDENDKVVFEGTTDENGYLSCELPYGKYKYKEVEAPKNYKLDNKEHSFEFTEDGQIFTTTEKNEFGGDITVTTTPETPSRQITTNDTPNVNTGSNRTIAPFCLAITLCGAVAIVTSKRRKK